MPNAIDVYPRVAFPEKHNAPTQVGQYYSVSNTKYIMYNVKLSYIAHLIR